MGGKVVRANRNKPGIILRDGKPRAVILDILEYPEILEHLENAEYLKVPEDRLPENHWLKK